MKISTSHQPLPIRMFLSVTGATLCALVLTGCGGKAPDTTQAEANSPATAQAAQAAANSAIAAEQAGMANRQAAEAKGKAAFDQAIQKSGSQ